MTIYALEKPGVSVHDVDRAAGYDNLYVDMAKGNMDARYICSAPPSLVCEHGSADLEAQAISASPTACPLRGYGRAGTQNDRLSEAVILSTGTPIPAQWTCRRRRRDRAVYHARRLVER